MTDTPRYQVAIDTRRKNPLIVELGAPLVANFNENLVPGRTYQVDFYMQHLYFYPPSLLSKELIELY